jgi:hypothetical protein
MPHPGEVPRRRFSGSIYIFSRIDIQGDYVLLDDMSVYRPPHVTPEEWRDFWAEVEFLNG